MFILNSCSKLMSKPNNDLYREFCKDFKNNKKSQIKTLTYTELEDSVIYNLINNDLDLDEEKKKIEYSVEYTTNMTYMITLFSLIPTFLGLILPILCATTEKLDLDLAFSLVGIILAFWPFYILFCCAIYNLDDKIKLGRCRKKAYQKMKLRCIEKILYDEKGNSCKKMNTSGNKTKVLVRRIK